MKKALNLLTDKKRTYLSIGAFAAPIAVMLITYYLMNIHPFGERTLLTVDLDDQYISFFSYMRQMLTEGISPLYTFSKNLGGDMVGLGAYYLLSPLNLIFLFFKTENFPTAVLILTLLKIGLSGLTMSLLLNRSIRRYSSILFSSAYALMAYNIVYQQNIMWLDGVILLPVIIIGIDNILKGRSPLCYIFSLGASILINYYIGFMLCIFSALYFICGFIFFRKENTLSLKYNECLKPVCYFGISSILAGGLSAFIVFPAFFALEGGKATFAVSALTFEANFHIFDLPAKFLIGSFNNNQMVSGLPNIYSGMFVLVFCILYFVSSKAQMREKIGFGILLLAITASFHINSLNLIWHGFNPPVWFPYRYSFIFSFLLIVLAYKGYCSTKQDLPVKKLVYTFLSVFLFAMLIEKFPLQFLDIKKIYMTIVILFITMMVFALYFKKNTKILFVAAACICFFDLGLNAFMSLNWMSYANYNNYREFVSVNQQITDRIKDNDSSFYRMEKTYRYNFNDAMMFNYNGLSHYSSSEKAFVKTFMEKMGFRNNRNWAYYNQGSTISVDSLLGVKYLLTENHTIKPYELLWQQGDVFAYFNPYALPIGFMVNEDVLNVSIHQENLFEIQNDIWKSMTQQSYGDLFFPARINSMNTANLAHEEYDNGIRYIRVDNNQDAFIEFIVQAKSDDPLYVFFPTSQRRPVEIFLNEESLGMYFYAFRYDIVELGNFEVDETIVFRMELSGSDVFINAPLFYHQNMSAFYDYYNELSASPFQITRFTKSYFEGEITNHDGKQFALFTIPYEEDWKISVSGNPVSAIRVFDTLTAVEIPEGTHSITLRYVPRGLNLGIVVTSGSCAILLAWIFLMRWQKQKGSPAIQQRAAGKIGRKIP